MADEPNSTIIDTSNLLGTTVSDRYEVQQLVGEGSMGLVFLAEHTHMKKKVALKVMRAEFLSNPEAVERFQREAQATGHIEHPHVCAATDFGRLDDERFFLVMEYLDGRTLGRVLDAEERLAPERAVKITKQIAQGLQRAHELEVVHRDLKPDNVILLEREGDPDFVKITDFGVARVEVVDAQNLTRAGTTMGTPVYMSPEQAVAKRADERSDLYTLGVMLFEMLTGEVPFYSESLAVILSKHASEPPPLMHEVAPDALIPEDLCDIVEKLLDKRPDERFQTAAELIDALDAADLAPYVPGLAPQTSEVAAALSELSEDAPSASEAPESAPSADVSDVSGSDMFASDTEVAPTLADEWVPPGTPAPEEKAEGLAERFAAAPAMLKYGVVFVALLALAVPIVAGAIILIAATGSEDSDSSAGSGMAFTEDEVTPPDLASERQEFLESVDLAEKAAKLGPAETAAALEPLLAEHGGNAHLQFLIGKSKVDAGQTADAMTFYATAVGADPRYAQEERVLSDARRLFGEKAEKSANAAKPVMLALFETPSANEAQAAVFETAMVGSWAARKRGRDLLKEAKRWEGLAGWQRDAVDLGMAGKDCKRVLKLVRSLSKSGEPDALPALQKASRRSKEGCGFLNKQDCYKCARKDLASTIRKLEREAEKPTPDAG